MAQGEPGLRLPRRSRLRLPGLGAAMLVGLLLLASPWAAAACPGPTLQLQPIGPGVWWLPGQLGDSDAGNRGQVSSLLLVREPGAGRAADPADRPTAAG